MKPSSSLLVAATLLLAQEPPPGWMIRPAGRQTQIGGAPMSMAASKDGRRLIVLSAGSSPSLTVWSTATGSEVSRVSVPDAWMGLALSADGRKVYAGGGASASVFEFDFDGDKLTPARTFPIVDEKKRTLQDFAGDVQFSPDGRLLYVAMLQRDKVIVINPQSGRVIEQFASGRRPYRIVFHPDGRSYFVSSWADASIYQYDAINGDQIGRLRLGPHTTDMALTDRKVEQAEGEEPSPYTHRIFVTAGNTNRVYVVGVTVSKEMRLMESINVSLSPEQPAGMTPSAVSLSADQTRLHVACSDANAVAVADVRESRSRVMGFVPTGAYPAAVREVAGGKLAVLNASGSITWVDTLNQENLDAHTKTVTGNTPYRDTISPGKGPAIEHVVYVVTLNGAGNAKLASEYTRLENFEVEGTGGARYDWATAGIAPDYAVRLGRHYDPDRPEPAATPPAGYLWTNALSAGLSVRNYGIAVVNSQEAVMGGVNVQAVRDLGLAPVTNRNFRGPDPAYPDVERAKAFLADLAQMEKEGAMPRLSILRLEGSDSGAALSMIIDGISKTRFWPKAAVFVSAPALIASPYTRGGTADKTPYSTSSMLRTMELILGLKPMTHFDAAARPMFAAFAGRAGL